MAAVRGRQGRGHGLRAQRSSAGGTIDHRRPDRGVVRAGRAGREKGTAAAAHRGSQGRLPRSPHHRPLQRPAHRQDGGGVVEARQGAPAADTGVADGAEPAPQRAEGSHKGRPVRGRGARGRDRLVHVADPAAASADAVRPGTHAPHGSRECARALPEHHREAPGEAAEPAGRADRAECRGAGLRREDREGTVRPGGHAGGDRRRLGRRGEAAPERAEPGDPKRLLHHPCAAERHHRARHARRHRRAAEGR